MAWPERLRSSRARLTLVTSALVLVAVVTTVGAIIAAMALIPSYDFRTTVTPAGLTQTATPLTDPTIVQAPTVATAVTVGDTWALMRTLLIFGACALLLVGAAGVGGSWLLAGRVMRPLAELASAARRAGSSSLAHRVELTGAPRDIAVVGDAFNDMLNRLELSFDSTSRFAANASHELRTPLATTRLLLEEASRERLDDETIDLLDRLSRTNERTIGIVAALLNLADAESAPHATDDVDLGDATAAAAQGLEPLALERGIVIELLADPAPIVGDPVLIEQAVSNLIRNAIQHNDARGRVRVRVEGGGAGRARVLVANTGPLVDADLLPRLLEPFYRRRGRVSGGSGSDSHGLGLALVSRIAAVHDAQLSIRARPDGGLEVILAFGG